MFQFENRFNPAVDMSVRPMGAHMGMSPELNSEWSKPERRAQNPRSPSRFGYAHQKAERMKTSDV